LLFASYPVAAASPLQVATFVADVSPPVGSPLAYDPTRAIETPLTASGVVLLGSGKPIVLCSVDWIGIANGGRTAWRTELAEAAGTTVDRVALHTVHQHDAPACDFTTETLLAEQGLGGKQYDVAAARRAIGATVEAVRRALKQPHELTHIGIGRGEVKQVASNRRVIGEDGKIKYWRGSTTGDPKARAEPEGLIDPDVHSISFFSGEKPIAVMCYYATHPMSYYRTGKANADFVGLARDARQQELGVPHIYFTGAAGNVAAGKYNDGDHKNRQLFADRLAAGMALAWKDTKKHAVDADDVAWRVKRVAVPPAEQLVEDALVATLENKDAAFAERYQAARELAWLRRCKSGEKIDLSCLHIGPASIVHMCGELFIEYQLAAQKMQPERFVALAAYGEYAMGYIGTENAYPQGGYEVSRRASRVAPEVENVLMTAMRELLQTP
jgi:hypothetical protein